VPGAVSVAVGDPRPARAEGASDQAPGGFAAALVITVTVAIAAALVLIAAQLLVIHSDIAANSPYHSLINQQNQSVKTDVYLISFLVILPLSLFAGPRITDAIASGRAGIRCRRSPRCSRACSRRL